MALQLYQTQSTERKNTPSETWHEGYLLHSPMACHTMQQGWYDLTEVSQTWLEVGFKSIYILTRQRGSTSNIPERRVRLYIPPGLSCGLLILR
jgi:hypothetical protein